MQKPARMRHTIRNIVLATVAPLALAAAHPAWSMEELLMLGEGPSGPAVKFGLEAAASPVAILMQVESCDAIGANASIYIDNARVPAYSHVFSGDECVSAPEAGTICHIRIDAAQEDFRMVMMVFRLGSKVRVKIETPGKVLFDRFAPLGDFAQDLEG